MIDSKILLQEGLADLEEIKAGRAGFKARLEKSCLPVDEFRRREAAKRRARAIGLAYWPALAYGPKIDPTAYKVAEEIMAHREGGYRWGSKLPNGELSHGGWDSWGQHGLGANVIAAMWMAAGCQNSKKFWLQITYDQIANKGDSAPFFAAFCRGKMWATKNCSLSLSRKAVAALGRLPWYCRWAAISGLTGEENNGKPLRIRHLNWDAVKVARKGVRTAAAAGFLPARAAWMVACPEIIRHDTPRNIIARLPRNPWKMRLGTLRRLWTECGGGNENIIPVINLIRLFGADETAMRAWIGSRSIHDAGQLVLPEQDIGSGWGRILLETAGAAAQFMAYASTIESAIGHVPNSAAEFWEVLEQVAPGAREGAVSFLSDWERKDYEILWATRPKSFVGIPAPGGSRGIEMGGYKLVQLQHDDIRQPLAGRLTDCCQHLHGAAASCARASWHEGDAAIWAVFDGTTMVAQSFVWRTRKGDAIVLDSVEAKGGVRNNKKVADIFRFAAQAVIGKMGVLKVYVGTTNYGITSMVIPEGAISDEAPECSFHLEYTDAKEVAVLAEDDEITLPEKAIRKAMRAAIEAASGEQMAIEPRDEFAEGSGVFCEFCEAEVHPDCEICPSCGQNIAEWVEEEEMVA